MQSKISCVLWESVTDLEGFYEHVKISDLDVYLGAHWLPFATKTDMISRLIDCRRRNDSTDETIVECLGLNNTNLVVKIPVKRIIVVS